MKRRPTREIGAHQQGLHPLVEVSQRSELTMELGLGTLHLGLHTALLNRTSPLQSFTCLEIMIKYALTQFIFTLLALLALLVVQTSFARQGVIG